MAAVELYKQKPPFDPSKCTAFVFITAGRDSIGDVLGELGEIDAVKERASTLGVYDIVSRAEALTYGELKEIVQEKIRRINKVLSTVTLVNREKDTDANLHGFCRDGDGGFIYINPPENKLDANGRLWWDYVPGKRKPGT
jgi:hypothetical protein